MNMISTGAFQAEMDASNKQETMAEKFARVWEKKNSKVARAGGVSLMALSLAACGSSSDTTTTTPTTPTTPAEPTTPVVTPNALVMTTAATDFFDADDFTSGADTVTADATTYQDGDIIADGTSGDGDTLTVALTGNMAATPMVVGIENIVFNVTAFADATIDATDIASGTITVKNLQLAGATGVDMDGVGSVTIAGGTGVTGTIDVAMVADAATVVNSGSATILVIDAAAVTAAELAAQTITVVTAGDVNLTATDANTVNVSGTGDVTLNGNSADLAGATGAITGSAGQALVLAVTDDLDGATVSGFDSVSIDTTSDGDNVIDAVDWSGTIIVTAGASTDTLTIASGANVTVEADQSVEVDIDDGVATTTTTTGVANVILSEASTAGNGSTIKVEETGDLIGTLNITAAADQTAADLTITAATAVDVTLAGAGDVSLDSSGFATTAGSTLDATDLTGNLTVTADAQLLDITGGSGDDSITALTAAAFDLTGGDGDDTLVTGADMTTGTFTGFEILTVTTGDDFLSSQLNGYTAVVTDIAAGGVLDLTAAAGGNDAIDTTTVDLRGLTFESAGDIVDAALGNIDAAAVLAGAAITYHGVNAIDQVDAGANADIINTYGGDDVVTGGAGDSVVDLGAGDDTFNSGTGAETVTGGDDYDDFVIATGDSAEANMDTIADYDVYNATDSDADTLTIDGSTNANGGGTLTIISDIATGSGIDVTSADADATAADIDAIVTDGIITLEGTQVARIDTLAEWIDVAEKVIYSEEDGTAVGADSLELAVAFEFDGDTYVVTVLDDLQADEANFDGAADDVIMLADLTGATLDLMSDGITGAISIA